MAATPTTDIPLGFEAPSFALTDSVTGNTVTSDDVFAGGPTVVVFMCNHCPFVVHILDAFVAIAAECRDRGVNVVAISSNDVVNAVATLVVGLVQAPRRRLLRTQAPTVRSYQGELESGPQVAADSRVLPHPLDGE